MSKFLVVYKYDARLEICFLLGQVTSATSIYLEEPAHDKDSRIMSIYNAP